MAASRSCLLLLKARWKPRRRPAWRPESSWRRRNSSFYFLKKKAMSPCRRRKCPRLVEEAPPAPAMLAAGNRRSAGEAGVNGCAVGAVVIMTALRLCLSSAQLSACALCFLHRPSTYNNSYRRLAPEAEGRRHAIAGVLVVILKHFCATGGDDGDHRARKLINSYVREGKETPRPYSMSAGSATNKS